MRIRIQVIIEADHEATPTCVEEVACFERGSLSPETLGLQLDEAKQLLAGVQHIMTAQQVEDYVDHQRPYPHCRCYPPHFYTLWLRKVVGALRVDVSLRLSYAILLRQVG